MTERLFGMHESRGFVPAAEAQRIGGRITALIDCARTAGFEVTVPKEAAPFVDHRRPSSTRIIDDLLGPSSTEVSLGRLTQGYLSMFVHASATGVLSTASISQRQDLGNGRVGAPLASNAESVNNWLGLIGLAYVTAVRRHRDLMGWVGDELWNRKADNFFRISRSATAA
jgi:hypothetical protein